MPARHSPQFKEQVIQYSLSHPEQTVTQTSKQFGLGDSTLDKWLREHRQAFASQQTRAGSKKHHLSTASNLLGRQFALATI